MGRSTCRSRGSTCFITVSARTTTGVNSPVLTRPSRVLIGFPMTKASTSGKTAGPISAHMAAMKVCLRSSLFWIRMTRGT